VSTIRFLLNGEPVEVDVPGMRRLLDVLREDLGLTGTKEGCGEGECGACTVIVDSGLVVSCLVPVCQVDGHVVRTVEGLAPVGLDDDGRPRLSPLQAAFLETGGAQCGICTPGMLMAAQSYLDDGGTADETAIRAAIAGNLCRCTGYTKIIDAIALAAGGGVRIEPTATAGAAGGPSADVVPAEPAGGVGIGVDSDGGQAMADQPPSGSAASDAAHPVVASLAVAGRQLGGQGDPASRVRPHEPPVESPATLADAYRLLADGGPWRAIAGGTDLMVELASGRGDPPTRVLDLHRLRELRGISLEPRTLVLGSMTTYSELLRSRLAGEIVPALVEAAGTVGAAQIQRRGTIGGNLATASPAADTAPVLLALDASVVLGGPSGERTVPIDEFFVSYRQTSLRPDELILRVRIPIVPGREVRFRKVGTRRAQAISKVSLALAWRDGADGPDADRAWRGVRVALGSMAATPTRARATEAMLEGASPSRETADRAATALAEELHPIDDVRSTAEYRSAVASRVLHRLLRDAGGW
jgi:xanthine dehydrogenase small subunit